MSRTCEKTTFIPCNPEGTLRPHQHQLRMSICRKKICPRLESQTQQRTAHALFMLQMILNDMKSNQVNIRSTAHGKQFHRTWLSQRMGFEPSVTILLMGKKLTKSGTREAPEGCPQQEQISANKQVNQKTYSHGTMGVTCGQQPSSMRKSSIDVVMSRHEEMGILNETSNRVQQWRKQQKIC